MKNTRKLIPALAMLLVSAVMMSTASFAWFSMNSKVTVSSMTVKATASKNLLISDQAEGSYAASLALTTTATTMVPTSTAATTTSDFFKIKETGTNMEADSSAYGEDTVFEKAVEGTDYIHEVMFVKSTGQAASDLRAEVTFTGGDKALDPSLRVMFVVGGKTYVYAPVNGYSSYKGIKEIDDAGKPSLTDTNITITANSSIILTSLDADEAVKIDVYIWYEGQDAACKSTNAVTLGQTVFTINYTVSGDSVAP